MYTDVGNDVKIGDMSYLLMFMFMIDNDYIFWIIFLIHNYITQLLFKRKDIKNDRNQMKIKNMCYINMKDC